MFFEQFFKVFRTLHNTRPGSEKNLLLSLYQFWFNTVDVNNDQVNQLTVSLAYTQCLVGFVNIEIVYDEVDIPGSPPFKGLYGNAPLERGISLVEVQ